MDPWGSLRVDNEWKIYAVLECGLNQSSSVATCCWDWNRKRPDEPRNYFIGWASTHQFWVYENSSKLTIHVLAHNKQTSSTVALCSVSVEPNWALSSSVSEVEEERVACTAGHSSLCFSTSFTPEDPPTLKYFRNELRSNKLIPGNLTYSDGAYNGISYAVVTVRSTMESPLQFGLLTALRHGEAPFINPVAFIYQSEQNLFHLVSPIPGGGNLFAHLQKERCFEESRVRKYGAELVIALEWLHKNDIIASVRPEMIMLDCFDHICLCAPAVFVAGTDTATAECPAPELHHGLPRTEAADWWDLGVFLYEMLTGLPPFFPASSDYELERKTDDGLFPTSLSVAAKDLLSKLLQPDPEIRLSANGISEIKEHPFFEKFSWDSSTSRDMQVFLPGSSYDVLNLQTQASKRESDAPVRRISDGFLLERHNFEPFPLWLPVGKIMTETEQLAYSNPSLPCLAWNLGWEQSAADFRFSNSLSGESRLADEQALACGLKSLEYQFSAGSAKKTNRTPANSSLPGYPTSFQMKRALVVALELQCSEEVVCQILDYGLDLDTSILTWEEKYDTYLMSECPPEIPVTPLEWAIEHQRSDLVDLFLNRGADPNYTNYPRHGPALVTAVLRKNCALVRRLVDKTDRFAATRALCLAIEQEDRPMVEAFLASSVRFEFEEADWPHPPGSDGCTFRDQGLLHESDLTPPLARAVRLGNIELVRLLLARGADPNVAYHDLCRSHPREHDHAKSLPWPEYVCGRPVQLAMELGLDDIVEALIRSGADIYLPQPRPVQLKPSSYAVTEVHNCSRVARSVYLDITSRLRAIIGKIKSEKS
ncbi:hypothetical protein NQ176_g2181 [Zarea fungicola]|uniref:Uncharacterized protein n=1 Tax=Zarea fungicola TaxID=93591 RepID=A0ACC1NPD7_9HYPO|nr:hypothetical protein NQ176_g2181 [Lecanicillium fungicola]